METHKVSNKINSDKFDNSQMSQSNNSNNSNNKKTKLEDLFHDQKPTKKSKGSTIEISFSPYYRF